MENKIEIQTIKGFRMQVDGLMKLMIVHTSSHPLNNPNTGYTQLIPGMSREVSDCYESQNPRRPVF
jgi:hypothetical protein